jgi:predicted regulator of Ras-like GTPase activity (Roadblock/LC7/MglB family)
MMDLTPHSERDVLTSMLDELAAVPSVVYAAVLSTDGLLLQKSSKLTRDDADRLAASASGMYSLALAAGRDFGSGPVQHIMIEYLNRTLFVAAAGRNGRLAVLCDAEVELGTVAYEIGRLVDRLRPHLGAEARSGVPTPNGP